MRNTIFLITSLALCLSLCSCGAPATFSAAAEQAEEKILKWDEESYNAFGYASTYPHSREAFTVIMTAQSDPDPIMHTASMTKATAREIFKETSRCFAEMDTTVVIAVMSADGELMYTFVERDFR